MSFLAGSDLLGISRRGAEQLMDSTCTIREPSTGRPVTDPNTGSVTIPPGPVVYAGPCRVKPGSGQRRQDDNAGGVEIITFDYLISVPFSVSGVREHHRVTIDTSPDPALVEVEVEVRYVDRGEHITARRLACAEVV